MSGESMSESLRVLVVARLPFRLDDLDFKDSPQFEAHLIRRAESLEETLDDVQPDVVLVDTQLPDSGWVDAIEQALARTPETRVLALTPDPPPHDQIALAIRAGASGFIDIHAEPAEFSAAIRAVHQGEGWFPSNQTRDAFHAVAEDLETTTAERRSRLTGMVLALIPLTGLIAALQAGLWRRYVGQLGVRPVDLAVDPASRVIDAITAMFLVVGVFGPLLFVGSWLDLLRDSRLNRGLIARFLQMRKTAHLVVSALWLVIATVLASGPDAAIVLFIGPAVSIAIIAKALGASDELPRAIRIEGVSTGVAVGGALFALLAFMAVLSYEVLVVGPDLRTDGVHGVIAPTVLGVKATPVRAMNLDTGEEREMLYLGGNADLYVLIDPCDDDRVDYVSVGTQLLTVIDEVTCPTAPG